jgi:hypothetical protein
VNSVRARPTAAGASNCTKQFFGGHCLHRASPSRAAQNAPRFVCVNNSSNKHVSRRSIALRYVFMSAINTDADEFVTACRTLKFLSLARSIKKYWQLQAELYSRSLYVDVRGMLIRHRNSLLQVSSLFRETRYIMYVDRTKPAFDFLGNKSLRPCGLDADSISVKPICHLTSHHRQL